MTPQEYCEAKTAQSGSSFYYSFLSLPTDKRRAIIALYAFCREVDDVADANSDIPIKRLKLAWWRDEIKRLFAQQAQHPITLALTPVIAAYNLPLEYFLDILDGMEMDLVNSEYPFYKELSLYCYRVASVVGLMSAEIFGYQDRNTLKYAHELGMAFQLTNIIRDVHEDAGNGRIYLPADELQQFGVNTQDIRQGKQTAAFTALIKKQADRALAHYQNAFACLPETDRYAQRAGIIMAGMYQSILREIIKDNYRVLHHRISLPPLRKLWILWSIKLREKLRHWRLKYQQPHG